MKLNAALFLVGVSLLLGACAAVGVKVRKPAHVVLHREALRLSTLTENSTPARLLVDGQQMKSKEATRALALLQAAESTSKAKPGTPEEEIHLAATRGLLFLMAERGFAPLPLGGGRTLGVSGNSRSTLDPRAANEILPAADIQISKLRGRSTRDGAGLPCVARFEPHSPSLNGEPGTPPRGGICEPVTALIRTDGTNPALVFHRTLNDGDVTIHGRRVTLAADFTAPLAYMLSKGRNRAIDIGSLVRSDKNFAHTGLYQFQRYDPKKIPVVFVHGLLSRPETWMAAVNSLLADEKIRERYQFWFFLYPTGLPVWGSAAELRSELERFRLALDPDRSNQHFDRMVLVGHSMGGLVSSLQVRTGGKTLWKQFMDTPPDRLSLSPALRNRIVEVVEFQPRPEVARVVFFATPHRGSNMAVHPATEFFSRLIRLPVNFLKTDVRVLQSVVRNEFRDLFTAPANSLVFLRANSPLLESILSLPVRQGLPYHSIVGDQGKNDSPNSSDGVVPYWSSRMEGAVSEKIVPSGHGAHEHPEGIAELARILHSHR